MQVENQKLKANFKPEKGPQHRQLRHFVGHWRIEGEDKVHQKMTGEETYEWLDGEFFLMNRFERKTADSFFKGISWIEYDLQKRNYVCHMISNLGFHRVYNVEISDHLIVLLGETERGTIRLSPAGDELSIFWDECSDGHNWHSLCNLRGYLQRSQLDE